MLKHKCQRLRAILKGCGKVLVAYSGGTDSALLLAVAAVELGDRVLAVTASSPTSTGREIREAKDLAKDLCVRHLVVNSKEMQVGQFIENSPQRCYVCKYVKFSHLKEIAEKNSIPWVLDGSNLDDLNDFRPGKKAAEELGIRSPLQEAELTKAEIRELSRQMGLPTWNKPSSPCLATRIPYGQEITEDKLRRAEKAEEFLKTSGFSSVRVRHYNMEARIEVNKEQFSQLAALAEDITAKLKELGFTYVTMDLAGFRSGSMNQELN